ncbi:MAG: hypothetical protein WBE44_11020, partial [Terriglobales bacterium]
STAGWVLHDPLTVRRWWLVPIQDLISVFVWVAGLFGNTIDWRGRRYTLLRDGRFQFAGSEPGKTEAIHGQLRAPTESFRQPDIRAHKTGAKFL